MVDGPVELNARGLMISIIIFFSVLGLGLVLLVGSAVWSITGSLAAGITGGAISTLPYFWALRARMRDDQELKEYYSDNEMTSQGS